MNISSFARQQLLKYGWEQGKGLGKEEQGISAPIKASLKFDNAGIGFDVGQEFTNHWWNDAFNKAAKSISVINTEDGVKIQKHYDAQAKKKSNYKHETKRKYHNFVQSGVLLNSGKLKKIKHVEKITEGENVTVLPAAKSLDEAVFQNCKGRTAHKAARLGMKLNGKLKRVAQQEEQCKYIEPEEDDIKMKTMMKTSFSDYGSTKKRKQINDQNCTFKNKKRKKKK